jgi:hypothetical protein
MTRTSNFLVLQMDVQLKTRKIVILLDRIRSVVQNHKTVFWLVLYWLDLDHVNDFSHSSEGLINYSSWRVTTRRRTNQDEGFLVLDGGLIPIAQAVNRPQHRPDLPVLLDSFGPRTWAMITSVLLQFAYRWSTATGVANQRQMTDSKKGRRQRPCPLSKTNISS